MKLYLTLERHAQHPAALCPSVVPARRLSPIVALQWQESVPASVAVSPAPAVDVPAADVLAAALVPAALVADATESVRGDLTVRHLELAGGKAEVRTDASSGTTVTTIDEIHVASAALLDQRGIRVQGTTGFSAKHSMTAPKPNGGVRGIPPRGRPV
ncbi:hypothetical protein [Dactylosporangium matsuzakiense]|uniref:Uncharacterized protein n=1 Tax=Dactylosporangium matsuzakiense TaxID=53360 RepID=A0A9W6KEH0_9ACTN|nr:hypothetical protein [Dactylosporangium matsuzakiense]UWZ45827.1 hypothetical protein Dmats_04885 [Dactylosporangium matsuzakiense]GLL00038.1 hypothetical protein GCM10017581_017780 [Dactylosporangium matsuzakiense]